jgi:hypothetical protein
VLIFSFIGFKTVEYSVNVVQPEHEILIDMMYDNEALMGEVFLGEIVITRWYSTKRWWWKIESLF